MVEIMKRIIIYILSAFIMLAFCGCSTEEEGLRTHMETQGNLQITYIYSYDNIVVSKNIYDTSTGITTEYFYFYDNKGWGEHLIGTSVVTIDKEGQIIDKLDNSK